MMDEVLLSKYLGLILILLAFFCVFKGTEAFYTGFHNVDLAHNFQKVAVEINDKLAPCDLQVNSIDVVLDNTTDGTLITLTQGYKIGINMMLVSNVYFIISAIALTVGVLLMFKDSKRR